MEAVAGWWMARLTILWLHSTPTPPTFTFFTLTILIYIELVRIEVVLVGTVAEESGRLW